MKEIKKTLIGIITLSIIAIFVGLVADTLVNNEVVHASYNSIANSVFSIPGTSVQYLRGDDTWQTLNPGAMGVPSGTTAQYFDGTLALRTFPTIPAAQIQSDWNENNNTLADYVKNKPTINTQVINSVVSRSLNTNYTISTTQNVIVSYTVRIAYTITILVGSTGSISLQYSTNSGSTWITVSTVSNNLNLGLALTGYNDFNLSGSIPANALVRLNSTTTNATNTYQAGEETLI